ncbi:MAG: hypothetical protein MJZ34_07945 [Paludibacteraceae bacterium]|nr:hypothetical protein [Paludibacteraceae bacterium]
MKKFLVANSIGGAKITKGAWDYLVSNHLFQTGDYPSGETYASIWNKYFETLGGYKDEEEEYIRFNPYMNGSDTFRQIILNLVEELHFDYKELDELNDGHDLRIIEVPEDGLIYHITEDPECGAEYISQVHKTYVVNDDWYMRSKYHIKQFCRTHEDLDKIDYVIELDTARLAFDGDFAMAQCKDEEDKIHYFILKKVEYYKENDEHAKISYDIVNEDNTSNYYGGIYRDMIDSNAMESYCKLFERLK